MSRSRSSKLLLVLASVVVLGFGSRDLIFVLSKTVYVFENGASSSTRGEVDISE
jgi:hypothetical protein